MSSLLSDESISLIYTILVSSSESGHSRVTRASYTSYTYTSYTQSNDSCGTISFTSKPEALLNIGFQEFFQQEPLSCFPMSDMVQEEQSDPSICSTKFYLCGG